MIFLNKYPADKHTTQNTNLTPLAQLSFTGINQTKTNHSASIQIVCLPRCVPGSSSAAQSVAMGIERVNLRICWMTDCPEGRTEICSDVGAIWRFPRAEFDSGKLSGPLWLPSLRADGRWPGSPGSSRIMRLRYGADSTAEGRPVGAACLNASIMVQIQTVLAHKSTIVWSVPWSE